MDELKKLQSIFQTLSDYNRLGILKSICDKECSVGEIVKITNLSQPLISHNLRIIKENLINKMMGKQFEKMSTEEKQKMMDNMMDNFLGSMSDEEKKEMMSNMMPKMMGKMM